MILKEELSFSTGPRVVIILQLCLGLVVFLWIVGFPFFGGYYQYKRDLLILEAIQGEVKHLQGLDRQKSEQVLERRQLQKEFYVALSSTEKGRTDRLVEEREQFLNAPAFEKLTQGFSELRNVPTAELLWVLASIIIPIMLLFRSKWSLALLWLIPFFTLCYIGSNVYYGIDPKQFDDTQLLPKEHELLRASGSMLEQQKALTSAWETYLADHWGEGHIAKGEFNWLLQRVNYLRPNLMTSFWEKKSASLLLCYLLWNLSVALILSKKIKVVVYEMRLS